MASSNRVILVTGAAGLLGARLVEVLSGSGKIVAVVHSSSLQPASVSDITIERCDLTSRSETASMLGRTQPDVIINCAAVTDVDGCEDSPEIARSINFGIVENILSETSGADVRFVHLSTDYLFDGNAGPYSEDAVPKPLNVYGRTKLEAERTIQEWSGNELIIRTSALYDCADSGKANLFASTYFRLKRGEQVVSASDAYSTPIWALNLAEAVAETALADVDGILNIAGPEYISRYTFSQMIAARFGYPSDLVTAASLGSMRRRAPRPLLAGLDSSKATSLLRTPLLSPVEALDHPRFIPAQ